MHVFKEARAMRSWAETQAAQRRRIGLVPTMGSLHAGHVSLVKLARERSDVVAASIFVNPAQFGPKEDFANYPRDLAGDLTKLEAAGVAAVFAPEPAEIYPPGFDTYVVPERLAAVLCGASRPGHFRGVCTVVHALLRITRADVAVFGEKDYQQLTILRRMVRDLWLDVDVVSAPITREPDGLAMSSRNAYLSAEERRDALSLSRALATVTAAVERGEREVAPLVAAAREILGAAPRARIDYVEIVDAGDLTSLSRLDRPAVCCVAAFVGTTRLIDNHRLQLRG